MNSKIGAILIFTVSLILFAGTIVLPFGQLPERVASHFDASGIPDGWMSKSSFVISMAIVPIALAGVIVGICRALRFMPDSTINLPNRCHWLASENRADTFDFIFYWSLQLAAVLLLFFGILYLDIVHANLHAPARLGPSIWIKSAIAMFMISGLILNLWLRFRRTPKASA